MKYGESTFDILYLIFAVLTGIIILIRHRNKAVSRNLKCPKCYNISY